MSRHIRTNLRAEANTEYEYKYKCPADGRDNVIAMSFNNVVNDPDKKRQPKYIFKIKKLNRNYPEKKQNIKLFLNYYTIFLVVIVNIVAID